MKNQARVMGLDTSFITPEIVKQQANFMSQMDTKDLQNLKEMSSKFVSGNN